MDEGDFTTTAAFVPPKEISVPGAAEEEVVLTSWYFSRRNPFEMAEQCGFSENRAILILISLLLATLLVSYFLERRRIRGIFMHETIVALAMGAVVGLAVRWMDGGNKESGQSIRQMISFDHRYFFNLILPPIILNSGYDLKRKSFFRNFGTILTFAFAGTLISTLVIGIILYLIVSIRLTPLSLTFLDCMIFGSILSSTDPVTILAIFNQLKVDPDLFAVVFGESVLNDAVAIVLFTTLSKFHDQEASINSLLKGTISFITVFSGSLIIGTVIALLTALMLKHTQLHKHAALESCVISLLSYSSYLLSNCIHLSGIVSLLFCSITLKHYAFDNMSVRSRRTTKYMFRVLSQLAENFVFIYLGVSLFANQEQVFSLSFTFFTVIAVIVSRYASTIPLSRLLNTTAPLNHPVIPTNHQTILWWAGLRGAMAFALSFEFESSTNSPKIISAVRTTTLVVCVMSVIGLGGTVAFALQKFNVRVGVEDTDVDGESSGEEGEDWDDEIAFLEGEGRYRGVTRARNADDGGIRRWKGSKHPAPRSLSEDAATRGIDLQTLNHHHGPDSPGSVSGSDSGDIIAGRNGGVPSDEEHWFIGFDQRWMKPLFTRTRVGSIGSRRASAALSAHGTSPTRIGLLESGKLQLSSHKASGTSGKKVLGRADSGPSHEPQTEGLPSSASQPQSSRTSPTRRDTQSGSASRNTASNARMAFSNNVSGAWRNVSNVSSGVTNMHSSMDVEEDHFVGMKE